MNFGSSCVIAALVAHVAAQDSNQGSHTNSGSSASALVSTLIPIFLISSIVLVAFLFLRKRLPRVYQPRSFLASLPEWQRSPKQSAGFLGWSKEYRRLKDEHVIGHESLDNYLWLRFLRMLAIMSFVGCIITWPILFPVNATGDAEAEGLDILSFSHIKPGPRYYAQVFVSWIFLAWVMFLITRESRFFVRLRQHYYLSPYQSSRISSRTVLFNNISEDARSEEYIREKFAQVKSVWFLNVSEELAQKVEDRDTAAAKLEQGEIQLAQNYVKRQKKNEKKKKESNTEIIEKDRPTHRLPKLKFLPIGKKVNTVDWACGELHHLIPEIKEERSSLREKAEYQAACFVEFETVQAAYNAVQQCGNQNKMSLKPKEFAPTPDSIIWKNIAKPASKVKMFNIACTAFVWFLCIFWTIPVAVIGAITNINYLTTQVPFLSFINSIPSVILGVVTGLLPVILLAVLMALVPIICGILAGLFEPTTGAVQMKVQSWYFPFQVIQVFLVTTFASGASAVAAQIVQRPTTAPTLLAQNLPKASNFYISFFILFGLLNAALQLLNIVPLLFFLILGKILDKTPRKMFNRYVNLGGVGWGSTYAKFANLGVIALSYSSIAPLILGFAAVGFALLYLAFRYSMLFTLGTNVSTRGESYARALKQITTGIYLSEICLIGLFAIGVGETTQAVGPLVLEIIFLVATIAWHVWLSRSLKKLESTLPEQHMQARQQQGAVQDGDLEKSANGSPSNNNEAAPALSGPDHRNGMMARVKGFLHPEISAYNAAWLVSSCLDQAKQPYSKQEYQEAYLHPANVSQCPHIWIAKDEYGVSKQEAAAIKSKVGEAIEVTDEAAWIDEKGKLHWSEEATSAPIWEERVAY